MCIDLYEKINKLDYINLQGEYIRTYATYLLHLGYSYSEFKNQLSELKYIPEKFGLIQLIKCRNKNTLCFYCLKNNNVTVLYFLILLNTYLKGR